MKQNTLFYQEIPQIFSKINNKHNDKTEEKKRQMRKRECERNGIN